LLNVAFLFEAWLAKLFVCFRGAAGL